MDYEQFWMNLTESNELGQAVWKSEYTFKDHYGVSEFSPDEFDKLLSNLITDPEMFAKYYEANGVKKMDFECDWNCRAYQICSISEQNYQLFEDCLDQELERSTPSPLTSSTTSSSATSTAVVWQSCLNITFTTIFVMFIIIS